MNKVIKEKLNLIISIFIILQPILDLITGISLNVFNLNITFGIIVRMLFLIFIMYTTVFIYKKKKSLIYYLCFIIYTILYLVGNLLYKDINIFSEIQGLLRVFYFPILLISLYELKDEIRISKMTLLSTLLLYIFCIFIPIIFKVGFKTYQITKVGTLGFYNSANEISGIISLLTPIMFIFLQKKNKLFLKGILLLIYLIVILTVGTKTPLLSLCITLGATFAYYAFNWLKNKKYKPIIYSFTLIVIGMSSLLLILPKTNFYKNIEVHLDYLKVDNILDIFTEYELVDHFIFSQRLTFLENKHEIYKDSSLYQKLFGIGYINNSKTTKMIEIDYFDIYYSHGIIGFIIFFTIYIYVLQKVFKEKEKLTYERIMYLISLLLIIILSFFTGHIITAPSVSVLAIILILSLIKRNKRDLLFASVNFEVGGIETSLINLLNQIDYDKYNVTVVLEEKKGILLPRVNKKVRLEEVKVSAHRNIVIRKVTNLTRKLIFTIFNYNNYDCGCCYATYSLSSNKLARISSENTVFYIHSNYKYIYDKKEELLKFFDDRNIKEFRKIIFVANEARTDFLKFYKDLKPKCEVFANFIDVDMVLEKGQVKIDALKPKNKKLLVFVGRLDDHAKKLSRAINLIKEIDSLALWIVGDGPDRKLYEDLVEKYKLKSQVTFFGMKENPYPYMKQADYIILTSDYEGFPLIYLEAITLNKEIITTIDVSDSQLNIGKDYAYIVSKDEKKMVNEVKKILKDKGKMKKIDFKKIQQEKITRLEKIFNEVI